MFEQRACQTQHAFLFGVQESGSIQVVARTQEATPVVDTSNAAAVGETGTTGLDLCSNTVRRPRARSAGG